MTPFVKICFAALGFSASAVGYAAHMSSASAQSATDSLPVATQNEPAGTGGMVVNIDPKTGQILQAPVPGSQELVLSPAEQNAASTSSVGLVEQQAAGGGVMVDLQGRFQNPLIATIGPDGKVVTQHLHDAPYVTK